MALFNNSTFLLHSNFYRLFGTRRNGVDQAWSNGMAVILLTLGVFTWWMCITKDGGHDDLLRAFCEVSFFKVFPPFSFLTPMATGGPGLGAVLCLFVSLCFGVGGLDFPEYTMLIFLCGFPRILISLFVHNIWERRRGGRK